MLFCAIFTRIFHVFSAVRHVLRSFFTFCVHFSRFRCSYLHPSELRHIIRASFHNYHELFHVFQALQYSFRAYFHLLCQLFIFLQICDHHSRTHTFFTFFVHMFTFSHVLMCHFPCTQYGVGANVVLAQFSCKQTRDVV